MRLKLGELSRTAMMAALCAAAAPGAALAVSDAELAELRRMVLELRQQNATQERRLTDQERRLEEQRRLVDEQKRRLAEQERKVARQQQLGYQQGLLLTLQDQDIYELRRSDGANQGPVQTAEMTAGGDASAWRASAPGAAAAAAMDPARRRLGVTLAQGTAPVPPEPVPPSDGPVAPEPLPPSPAPPEPPAAQPPPPAPSNGAGVRRNGAQPDGNAARPKSEKAPDQLLVEAGGILLRPGMMQVEPSLEYSHFSTDRFTVNGLSLFEAIIIGQLRADDLERDVLTGAINTRIGLFPRWQFDFRVPGVYRQDSETLAVGTQDARDNTTNNVNLGDISASLSYQPILGRGAIPAVIVRLDSTFPTGEHPFEIDTETVGPGGETRLEEPPTGNGFWSVGATSTMVWTSDPVVFFAGGGYTYNIEREFDRFGDIDPGDSYRFFAGTNVALSDRVSLNFSFTDQITGRTEQNGEKTANSATNDARLILGTSVGLTPSTSILVSAGMGLTEVSPDFTFMVSVPITFRDLF